VYDADSNVAVSVLSPGLTYRLALVWEFGGPVPERLPLGLAKLTLRGVTISPDDLEWQDPAEGRDRDAAGRGHYQEAGMTWPVRIGMGIAVLAALAVGQTVDAALPVEHVDERPFVRAGGIGDRVPTR